MGQPKQLSTKERGVKATLRPLIFKYFSADFEIKYKRGLVKGCSEHLNNILEKHYNSLSEADKNNLLNK